MNINWEELQSETKSRAKEFIKADEKNRVWYIGGEILDSAIVCNAWDENIKKTCEWLLKHGKGLQPKAAKTWIKRNN